MTIMTLAGVDKLSDPEMSSYRAPQIVLGLVGIFCCLATVIILYTRPSFLDPIHGKTTTPPTFASSSQKVHIANFSRKSAVDPIIQILMKPKFAISFAVVCLVLIVLVIVLIIFRPTTVTLEPEVPSKQERDYKEPKGLSIAAKLGIALGLAILVPILAGAIRWSPCTRVHFDVNNCRDLVKETMEAIHSGSIRVTVDIDSEFFTVNVFGKEQKLEKDREYALEDLIIMTEKILIPFYSVNDFPPQYQSELTFNHEDCAEKIAILTEHKLDQLPHSQEFIEAATEIFTRILKRKIVPLYY